MTVTALNATALTSALGTADTGALVKVSITTPITFVIRRGSHYQIHKIIRHLCHSFKVILVVNFINFKREYGFNIENIKSFGIGSVAGYQFFLLNTSDSNLTLDVNMGGNFQIPYDIKNVDQYYNGESDEIDGLFLLPKYLRFNISVGYAF